MAEMCHVVHCQHGRVHRDVVAVIGLRYLIEPMNVQKKKHRGRTGVIEGFEDAFMPQYVDMRFDDTGKIGKVDISDLILLDESGERIPAVLKE